MTFSMAIPMRHFGCKGFPERELDPRPAPDRERRKEVIRAAVESRTLSGGTEALCLKWLAKGGWSHELELVFAEFNPRVESGVGK